MIDLAGKPRGLKRVRKTIMSYMIILIEGTGIMGVSQGEGAVEENSPMMLKERGDKMMANGDFRGA